MVKGSGWLYGSAGSHAFSNPEITAQMYAGRKRPGQRIGNVQGKKCVVPAENRNFLDLLLVGGNILQLHKAEVVLPGLR